MKINRFLLGLSFAAALPLILSAQMLNPALLTKPATDSWPTYNGDYSGRRFSPLTQIDQSNVKGLSLAWVYRTNAGAGPGAIVGGEGPMPEPGATSGRGGFNGTT